MAILDMFMILPNRRKGAWPTALIAQRRLRHKCSKGSYQFLFWLIVMAYQFAAFDSLQNWQFSRAAWDYIDRPSKHAKDAVGYKKKDGTNNLPPASAAS